MKAKENVIIDGKVVTAESGIRKERDFDKDKWSPKTALGHRVKAGEIKTMDEILDKGEAIITSTFAIFATPISIAHFDETINKTKKQENYRQSFRGIKLQ